MEDNHFSSQRWEEKREGWWEGRQREEIIVSGFFMACVCDRERQGGERGDGVSCCLLLCQVKETVGSVWAFDVKDKMSISSYDWRTECVGRVSNLPACVFERGFTHSQAHTHTGFSVFSQCLDLSSRSVSVTDEHASALKGIGLQWFRITWALRLWSQTAACAVLQWYYIIYNDIIDHYVSWHSTLNQHWFINQMMKGGCNSEIKGKERKTQTQSQHSLWDSLTCLLVSMIVSQTHCHLYVFCS